MFRSLLIIAGIIAAGGYAAMQAGAPLPQASGPVVANPDVPNPTPAARPPDLGSPPLASLDDGWQQLTQAMFGDEATLPMALQILRQVAGETAAKDAVPALTNALKRSQEAVIEAGTEPIPSRIRRKLDGFFAEELLDRVRYRIGWPQANARATNSAAPLAPLFLVPRIKAMTLPDIIVFRDSATANDIRIWVHELGHIQQYDRWGVEGFAERYVADFNGVEAEAWAVFDRFDTWARDQGRLSATDYEPREHPLPQRP
ncbi:MAG: DUF4157 domain-containing protein [Rhodospirillales bacterium]|nr:DUF4157 domain-containing protein [Rhodospirillales bacterium]